MGRKEREGDRERERMSCRGECESGDDAIDRVAECSCRMLHAERSSTRLKEFSVVEVECVGTPRASPPMPTPIYRCDTFATKKSTQ